MRGGERSRKWEGEKDGNGGRSEGGKKEGEKLGR